MHASSWPLKSSARPWIAPSLPPTNVSLAFSPCLGLTTPLPTVEFATMSEDGYKILTEADLQKLLDEAFSAILSFAFPNSILTFCQVAASSEVDANATATDA